MALHHAFQQNKFRGFIETVPAYASLAVFYDTAIIYKAYPVTTTAFDLVKNITEQLVKNIHTAAIIKGNTINIPVYYNGVDLETIATQHQLSVEEVIRIHASKTYRVFMIGFLPGFAYMGKVDERIATPRHATPRINVQAGSVGIADLQTGIYPLASPGGWQLIGQTPLKIFDQQKKEPCLFSAGDMVQFNSISKEAFNKLNEY